MFAWHGNHIPFLLLNIVAFTGDLPSRSLVLPSKTRSLARRSSHLESCPNLGFAKPTSRKVYCPFRGVGFG